MSLTHLTHAEKAVIGECLSCIARGHVIKHDWEFGTLMGVSIEEFLAIWRQWPCVDDTRDDVRLAIGNGLNNLLGYPHAYHDLWGDILVIPKQTVARVFNKWRN
jgi:hypothetical protein